MLVLSRNCQQFLTHVHLRPAQSKDPPTQVNNMECEKNAWSAGVVIEEDFDIAPSTYSDCTSRSSNCFSNLSITAVICVDKWQISLF